LVSLLAAYIFTAALSYLVARATWHLVERRAQDLAKIKIYVALQRYSRNPAASF
jgi:hypothetical protein